MAKLLKKLYKNLKQNLHLRSKLHRLFAVLFVLCLIIVPAIEIKNAEVKHPMAQYFYTAKIKDNCGSGIVHYDFYREIKICSWFKDYEIGDAKTFTFEVGEYRYNRCYYLHRPIDLFERRESLAKLIADTSNLWPELAHLIERQREANRSELARLSNPSGGQYRNIELCNSGMAQNKNEFDSVLAPKNPPTSGENFIF